MQVDLHCHSTASDGALAPAEVVARAHARGVRLLALTDHDTLEGIAEARAAAVKLGMQLVNGIELSSTWGGATIHVLGYAFSEEAPALRRAIADLHDGRWQRAEEIGRRLAAKLGERPATRVWQVANEQCIGRAGAGSSQCRGANWPSTALSASTRASGE